MLTKTWKLNNFKDFKNIKKKLKASFKDIKKSSRFLFKVLEMLKFDRFVSQIDNLHSTHI